MSSAFWAPLARPCLGFHTIFPAATPGTTNLPGRPKTSIERRSSGLGSAPRSGCLTRLLAASCGRALSVWGFQSCTLPPCSCACLAIGAPTHSSSPTSPWTVWPPSRCTGVCSTAAAGAGCCTSCCPWRSATGSSCTRSSASGSCSTFATRPQCPRKQPTPRQRGAVPTDQQRSESPSTSRCSPRCRTTGGGCGTCSTSTS
mmetsp:Transcript_35254/g.71860  ORF Transcript_35254/g.71860 Transcript_35254/m.71860 type:complete len:201 (-) Transcript_35254:393-995(-)